MVATTKAGIRPHNADLGLEHRYRALLEGPEPTTEAWLEEQLRLARALCDDLPDDPGLLPQWADNHAGRVASEHAAYLEQRRQGGPRRFLPIVPMPCGFCSKSRRPKRSTAHGYTEPYGIGRTRASMG